MTTSTARLVPTVLQDLALLLGRVALGVVLIAHGWQKREQGIAATTDGFASMGIPAPEAAAWFATYVELVGGVLLIVGLLTPLIGLLVAGTMAGAWWFAHRGAGVLSSEGGWELVAMIGLLALVVAAVGAGRVSLDHLLLARRSSDGPAHADDERVLVSRA